MGMTMYPVASIGHPTNEHNTLMSNNGNLSRDSNDSVNNLVLFSLPHLIWRCAADDPESSARLHVDALIDHGSPVVLIDEGLACHLQLWLHSLPQCFPVSGAFSNDPSLPASITLTHWVKLKLHDRDNSYSARTVHALVTPKLCHKIILGLPFMYHNNVTVNVHEQTAINSKGFDLLHPSLPMKPWALAPTLCEVVVKNVEHRKLLLAELHETCNKCRPLVDAMCKPVIGVDVVSLIHIHIEQLAARDRLDQLAQDVKISYSDVFKPIPHANNMPDGVQCKITLKDVLKSISMHSYSCPQKYHESWNILINNI